jgi:hypothetical protein
VCLVKLIAVSFWPKRCAKVKLSALPESSLDNGENGDQALGLEEMLWLCDFCVTGLGRPSRIYLVVHLRRCLFCDQVFVRYGLAQDSQIRMLGR